MLSLRLSSAPHLMDLAGLSRGASADVGVGVVVSLSLGAGTDRCGARRWDVSAERGLGASLRYGVHETETSVKVLKGAARAAVAGRSPRVIELTVLLVWVSITALLAHWFSASQNEWLKRLARRGVVSDEAPHRPRTLPGRWFFTMLQDSPLTLRRMRKKDEDPETERSRLRMKRRSRVLTLWIFPGSILYIISAALADWAIGEIQRSSSGVPLAAAVVIGGILVSVIAAGFGLWWGVTWGNKE
jgi:hypothetical protein